MVLPAPAATCVPPRIATFVAPCKMDMLYLKMGKLKSIPDDQKSAVIMSIALGNGGQSEKRNEETFDRTCPASIAVYFWTWDN
jgi:hypothetical protein